LFRDLVVKIILKVGNFGQTDVALTSACLGVLALGLFAQSLTLLTTKAFYAIHNTIAPAIASIVGMIANVSLALIFVKLFSFQNAFSGFIINFFGLHGLSENKVIALPLAFVISSVIQFVILQIFFKTKINKDFKDETHS
jgi:peptidoglycan biosynthesis protein MviN/MurJ (putative lipid II flippase)